MHPLIKLISTFLIEIGSNETYIVPVAKRFFYYEKACQMSLFSFDRANQSKKKTVKILATLDFNEEANVSVHLFDSKQQ